MMFGKNTHSDAVLHRIKEGSIGAEIGVWKGSSTEKFLTRQPAMLHLVDSWSVIPYQTNREWGTYTNYLDRYAELTGGNTEEDFQRYYDKTHDMVNLKYGLRDNVTLHRMMSDDWFAQASLTLKGQLDWIYIDGDHSYKGVLRDLNNAWGLVKKDGYILGDDFMWPGQRWGKEGVHKAVCEFVRKNDINMKQEGNGTQFSILKV